MKLLANLYQVISCESGLSIKTIAVYEPFNEGTIPLTITAVNYTQNDGTYVIDSVLSLPYGIEFSEGMFVVNISDSYGIATTMLSKSTVYYRLLFNTYHEKKYTLL